MNWYKTDETLRRLVDEKADIAEQKRRIELELSQIRSSLKITRPHHEYQAIIDRRTDLVARMVSVEKKIKPLKRRIRDRLDKLERQQQASGKGFVESITELRDHYQDFAADNTRVNSMRIMASEFASALTQILDGRAAQ